MSKLMLVGAEVARTYNGTVVFVYLMATFPDGDGKFCCSVIAKCEMNDIAASRILHSHLSMDEILDMLEDPGYMGVG